MITYYNILQRISGCNISVYPDVNDRFESNSAFWKQLYNESSSIASSIYYLISNLNTAKHLNEFIKMKQAKMQMFADKNGFLAESNANILDKMYETQRHYNAFATLAKIIKSRKPAKITTDLLLNPIENNKQVIKIYQNGANYLFSIRDLINIIHSSLSQCIFFHAEPRCIKNPYNNLNFSVAALYNIYYAIKSSDYTMSILYHQFFICGFDLQHFRLENEYLIRDAYIKDMVYNTSDKHLFKSMKKMIEMNVHQLRISDDIDKKEFIQIMRPYYYLYLIMCYHVQGTEKTDKAYYVLKKRLSELYEYNYKFGRSYLRRQPITRKFIRVSDLDHPRFTMSDMKKSLLSCVSSSHFNNESSSSDDDDA